MRFPPRLAHLATRSVVVSKLVPSFALAHRVEDDEATDRLDSALRGPLLDDLLEATWNQLQVAAKRPDEERLLEKIALALKDRPNRPGKPVESGADLAAFWILADVEAGTASDSARKLMETDAGKQRGAQGLVAAARLLAAELTRVSRSKAGES
jgi:hypothetical protein